MLFPYSDIVERKEVAELIYELVEKWSDLLRSRVRGSKVIRSMSRFFR